MPVARGMSTRRRGPRAWRARRRASGLTAAARHG